MTPSSPKELPYPATQFERFVLVRKRWLIIISFLAAFVLGLLPQVYEGSQRLRYMKSSSGVQPAHAIGLSMYAFANDHDGKYPQGKSSTEVFQQLLDGGYITDPTLFYFPMDGKVVASITAKKLKPENVCWDVTGDLTLSDTGELPLVFWTGFKVDYARGGTAHLVANASLPEGIAVFFVNNSVKYITANEGHALLFDGSFDPKGKTYRQLTPHGPLPEISSLRPLRRCVKLAFPMDFTLRRNDRNG